MAFALLKNQNDPRKICETECWGNHLGLSSVEPQSPFQGQANSPLSFSCLLHTQDSCLVSFLFSSCQHSIFLLDFASLILEWDTVLCSFLQWKSSTQILDTFNILLHTIFFTNKDLVRHFFPLFPLSPLSTSISYLLPQLRCVTTTQNSVTKTIHSFNS